MSVDPDKLRIIRSKPRHDSHSDAIRQFEGDYECLSNTYKCPVSLRGDLEPYPSVEHALQASKTDDVELKDSIRQAKNAIEAKKIARVVKPAPEWRAGSERIVEGLIRDKFRRNAKAREVLIGTGRVKLVYTNSHEDRVWGVCGGKGDNKLGKLLERVRADALAGKDTDVWCAMRFQLATPLDVAVDFAVTKGGEVVAEPSFEGKPIVRMGKLADNEVVMAHPSVSRSHALLVVDRTFGAFLVDLGASNGSFLDGRRVTPYVPEPVKAGGALLTFAKSKRTYSLTRVETDLREAKKSQLYADMSDPTASVGQPEPDSTIYVGNLEPSVTEDDLREFFADCGDIATIRIPQDKDTGRMRGIAFVAFTKHVGVLQALALHMDDLKGQSINIRRADAKTDSNKNAAKKPSHTRPGGPDATNSSGTAPGAAKSSSGWGEQAVGRGPGGGGAGGVGAPAQSSALELATAAIIRAAAAARANAAVVEAAAAAAAAAAVAPPASSSESIQRNVGDERHGSNSKGEERAGRDSGHRRKRGSRWGDSGGQEVGVQMTTTVASVDQVETEAKRRRTDDGRRAERDAGGREERHAGGRGERGDGGREERDAGRREERDAGGRGKRDSGGRGEADAGGRQERGARGASGHTRGVSRDESSRGGGRHGDCDDGDGDGGHGGVRKGEDGRRGSEGRGGRGGGGGGAKAALDGRDGGERNWDNRGRGSGDGGGAGGGGRDDRRGEGQRDNNNSASSERHGARDERKRRENGDNGHRGHHGKTERDRGEREDGGGRRHGETSRREGDAKKARHRKSEEREGRDRGHGRVGDEGRRRDGQREGGTGREGSTRGAEDGRKGRGSRDHGERAVRREERRSRSRSRSPVRSRDRR